jgi:hypothetical protein
MSGENKKNNTPVPFFPTNKLDLQFHNYIAFSFKLKNRMHESW